MTCLLLRMHTLDSRTGSQTPVCSFRKTLKLFLGRVRGGALGFLLAFCFPTVLSLWSLIND